MHYTIYITTFLFLLHANCTMSLDSNSTNDTTTSNNLVTIYHVIGRGGTKESIKKHGLHSMRSLYENNLMGQINNHPPKESIYQMPHFNTVNFNPPHEMNFPLSKCVGYQVDPYNTYVHNEAMRRNCETMRKKSEMLLATYLQRRREVQNTYGYPDPLTAKPRIMQQLEKEWCIPATVDMMLGNLMEATLYHRYPLPTYEQGPPIYYGEIIVNKPYIPPQELKFFDEDTEQQR